VHLPKPSESNFEPTPAGTHVGVCYRFIDRGTQLGEYKGVKKLRHEIMLTWELGDELMDDGRPFSISKVYTWSMGEKATLRHDLEAWRGKSFVNDDFDGPNAFDTKNLLGKPCMLTVTHDVKDGQTYAKLASVGKLTKGITPKPLVNPTVYLALNPAGWDKGLFESLSDKMRASIMASPEYAELMKADGRPVSRPEDDSAGERDFPPIDDLSDVPF
jgi:hypothetical protein